MSQALANLAKQALEKAEIAEKKADDAQKAIASLMARIQQLESRGTHSANR